MNTPLARKSRPNSWFTRASALLMVSLAVTCSGATLDASAASAASPHPIVPAKVVTHEAVKATAPPKAKLTVPPITTVGTLVALKTKGSNVPGHVRSVTIDFGDKSAKLHLKTLPATKSHRYSKVGRYTVTLKVVDLHNRVSQVSHKITVRARVVKPMPVQNNGTGAQLPKQSYEPPAALAGAALPASVQLTDDAVAPGYQGDVGSCVTWAIDYSMLGWYANHQNIAGEPFAPMYAYSQITLGGKDGGSYPKTALDLAQSQGVDTKAHYGSGYDLDWWDKPTASDIANAANYKISGYNNLFMHNTPGATDNDIQQIKARLAGGQPVAVSMMVYVGLQGFTGGRVYTDTSTTLVGGHEVLALGYDANGLFIENSWGTGWADGGFARLSWSVVAHDLYEADVISGLVPVQAQTDNTAPTATAPTQTMAAGTSLNAYGAPVNVSWSGSDNSGAVAGYNFYASTNGGKWVLQALSSATATSVSYHLTPGSSYQFAVRSEDAAGNFSDWQYGPAFTVEDHAETDAAIQWSAGWDYQQWWQADGGQQRTSVTPKAWAYFTFTGRNVAWVTSGGSNRGQANVFIDNKFTGTVDMYSSNPLGQYVAATLNAGSSGQHTVEIDVVGTSGRPDIDVDSFIVLR